MKKRKRRNLVIVKSVTKIKTKMKLFLLFCRYSPPRLVYNPSSERSRNEIIDELLKNCSLSSICPLHVRNWILDFCRFDIKEGDIIDFIGSAIDGRIIIDQKSGEKDYS